MKSYAALYPYESRMSILYDYDGVKKEIIEHSIPKIALFLSLKSVISGFEKSDFKRLNAFFNNVKAEFKERPQNICISITKQFVDNKNILIHSAKNVGLENFEVAEIYMTESLEAIAQSGYNLENNSIIWTCLNSECCVWQGKYCTKNKYKSLATLLVKDQLEAIEITEYPPDIFVYEKTNVKKIEANLVKELFPDCITIEYEKKDLRNTALTYAQFMEKLPYEDKNLNFKKYRSVYKKNESFPVTYIHVGINLLRTHISAVYYYNGILKEFAFRVKKNILFKDNVWSEIKHKLKIAEARLNGKFGYIYILKLYTNIEFKIEWAKEIEFEKVEVIDEKKIKYIDILSQLPFIIENTGVVWIFKTTADCIVGRKLPEYDIWENNIYQKSISHRELKKNLNTLKNVPNFIISEENMLKKTALYNDLKNYFPDTSFYSYKNQVRFGNALQKYFKMMAERYYSLYSCNSPKFDQNAALSNVEPNFTEKFGTALPKSKDKHSHFNKNNQVYEFNRSISINNNIKMVGIDLGTSRCCAAVNRKNGITTVHLDNKGERLLPSYVAYDEENPIFGQVVINRLRHYSKSTVFDSKRIIGRSINDIEIDSNWPFRISEENGKVMIEVKKCNVRAQITAEDVAGDLLRYIKQKSEEYQGTKLENVVITVPAAFTEAQKEATIRAAKLAGWKNANLLFEPVAAAFAYFTNKIIPKNENILVFDLGGGTLDVCIFKIENNQIKIISNTGDTKLGGRDFDTVLFNNFRNQLDVKHGIVLKRDRKFKLISECQQIKEDLSTLACRHLSIDEYDTTKEGTIEINRLDFEAMTKPLLNKIKNTINAALLNAKQNPENINKILLVGGGSRMPMIKSLLGQIFPEAKQCIHENPDEVVAIGAAYYAYSLYSQ